MADEESERTEQATERQIERYRREGRVATSRELTAAVGLTVGALCLIAALPYTGQAIVDLIRDTLSRADERDFVIAAVPRMTWGILVAMAPAVLVALLPAAVAALAAGVAETGFNFTTEVLSPKPERLEPFAAARNIFFSRTPWVQLAKSLAVSAAIAWATWGGLREHVSALPLSATWTVASQGRFMLDVVWDVLQRAIPVAIGIGALDYGYQRWSMSEQMKMSKQDVKQEMKEQDGDPLIKARRRAMARQIAFGRQLQDVQKADVVLTNPTHYAVAIRYRKEEGDAPIVLARGIDHQALQIRAEAGRHDVPTIENRPLARALHAKSKVGRPIPKDFFGPVAQVLAVVYKRRRRAP